VVKLEATFHDPRTSFTPMTLYFLLLAFFATVTAQDFDADIPMSSSITVEDVKAELLSTGKPGVVFVTQPWCGACKGLKKSINGDAAFKEALKDFVVVNVSGEDGTQWQAEGKSDGYIPRVYFLTKDGKMLDIKAPNPDYAYFFPSSGAVKDGMNQLLEDHKKGNSEL
jgi:thiol-disulfide isomerase/thioredoxin